MRVTGKMTKQTVSVSISSRMVQYIEAIGKTINSGVLACRPGLMAQSMKAVLTTATSTVKER